MKIRVFLCALQLLFAVSSVCFGKLGTSVILLLHTRCLSVRQTTTSLFISMSFVLDPLGLQCGGCESGGAPVCCDDVEQNENCNMTRPFTCDTRIRFLLRPFGASVETAPNSGYRYFTPSNGGNSHVFNEGPGGLLGLPNPFTITSTDTWTVSYYCCKNNI